MLVFKLDEVLLASEKFYNIKIEDGGSSVFDLTCKVTPRGDN